MGSATRYAMDRDSLTSYETPIFTALYLQMRPYALTLDLTGSGQVKRARVPA